MDNNGRTPSFWRFDALAPRAGMAFASRVPTNDDNNLDEDIVHFRPPAFQPELLGRASLALGATRRGFQGGLVIGNAEATFPSLAALGEFVRRAYVRGAAGDGAPGGGDGGEPPPAQPKLPDEPERIDDDRGEVSPGLRTLMGDMVSFDRAIAECKPGDATPMTWGQPAELGANWPVGDILVDGAAHVVRDTFMRWRTSDPHEFFLPIRRLSGLLAWMGCTDIDVLDVIRRRWPGFLDALSEEMRYAFDYPRPYGWTHGCDPLRALSQLEAPDDFGVALGPTDLLSWLSRFLATPTDGLAARRPRESLERAAFAAAVIVDRRDGRDHWWPLEDRFSTRRELSTAALNWVSDHLPVMAYCQNYETMLASVEQRE